MTKRDFFENVLKVKPSDIGTAVPFYSNGETEVTEEWLASFIKNLLEERTNKWHTGLPTETGEYLVCIRYDFGKEGYTTANYVEPYNPHTGWYNLKPPSVEDGHEWCKKNGIEVIAWQKITPYEGEGK